MSTPSLIPPPDESNKICEGDGGGLLLPLFEGENSWNKQARAFLYFVALVWCFLGVSIVADIFMCAIEAVTSKRRSKALPGGRTIHVKIWNPTVANLTLMALGSSAPEILLSIIEISANNFHSGELGPSTIVGSAAFNLMVIIAVCVYVIPSGERRTIARPTVFAITASFSVFAYLWLIVILSLSSPDIVEVWEGVLTFLFFPILVIVAWLADIGKIGPNSGGEAQRNAILSKLTDSGIVDVTSTQVDKLLRHAADEEHVIKSRAQHRVEASFGTLVHAKATPVHEQDLSVGFVSSTYVFAFRDKISLEIEKTGRMAKEAAVVVEYGIFSPEDKLLARAKTEILAGEKTGKARVTLAEAFGKDDMKEQYLWVEIFSAVFLKDGYQTTSLDDHERQAASCRAVKHSNGKVNVMSDRRRAKAVRKSSEEEISCAGLVRFEINRFLHEADSMHPTLAKVRVQRFSGSRGQLVCGYRTEADSARPVYDFEHAEGQLTFPDGAVEAYIEVHIARKGKWEGRDSFFIHLTNLAAEKPVVVEDGGSTCSVTILETGSPADASQRIMRGLDTMLNIDAIQQGNIDWRDQFLLALRPVSGDDEDAEVASASAWTLHFIALPWKLVFAFIPPTSYSGGWVCFVVALLFIGGVTAIIGDLASLMGCCMELPDSITAITIVALGTSLPDTFASKVAAVEDPSADNAIGNVTGSNSVNVFLGLGLPWMIASIYWEAQGPTKEWVERYRGVLSDSALASGGFAVPAGDLTFSVAVFTLCAVTTLATIVYRRYKFQAELGGPRGMKVNTAVFFVLLWGLYIGLASWKTLNKDASVGEQVGALFAGMLCMVLCMLLISIVLFLVQHFSASKNAHDKDRLRSLLIAMHATNNDMRCPSAVNVWSSLPGSPGSSGCGGAGACAGAETDLSAAIVMMKEHLSGLQAVCNALERKVEANVTKRLSESAPPAAWRSMVDAEQAPVTRQFTHPMLLEEGRAGRGRSSKPPNTIGACEDNSKMSALPPSVETPKAPKTSKKSCKNKQPKEEAVRSLDSGKGSSGKAE